MLYFGARLSIGMRAEGIRTYATRLTDDAQDYLSVAFRGPSAIVLGNEHAGCSGEVADLVDGEVTIPRAGFAQSLNVSVAAAVLLAEMARQRRGAPPPWIDRKTTLQQAWIDRESSAH